MNPLATIGAFVAGLAVVFVVAFAVGSAAGPSPDGATPHSPSAVPAPPAGAPTIPDGGHDGH
ncbi:hypothetical protein TPB0596_26910 [Tsukamurella pulmonis]|uniref:hypothetical protein n=1 Tax=Tsukamurella pulmonis TaxID=47312 RepID=UPI001EDD3542|nr:hypothetical protein [Tsukamurella pulmonis]BDD82928.1 hypothetical protein TPB0596_26910 [Tsukamurella pulmonis]